MRDSVIKRFLVKIINNLKLSKELIIEFALKIKDNLNNISLKIDIRLIEIISKKKLKLVLFKYQTFNQKMSSYKLRKIVLKLSKLEKLPECYERNIRELKFINYNSKILKPLFDLLDKKTILFCGQQYYHHSNLSEYLKKEGWDSNLYDWDMNAMGEIHYHKSDVHIGRDLENNPEKILNFYIECIYRYRIFHFSNIHGISFGYIFTEEIKNIFEKYFEINLLKKIGKKIFYTHTGCLDGVSKSNFNKDSNYIACRDCRWNDDNEVCNDKDNLNWGKIRNKFSDYQFCFGASFQDYNISKSIIETPYIYNINSHFWNPSNSLNKIHEREKNKTYLYHTIANSDLRLNKFGRNIKSSHIYLPLIEKLNANKKYNLELVNPNNVINKEIRHYIMKSDIVLDMLGFGWYGATSREALMLGKPVICYLNPLWLKRVGKKFPELVQEMPIISANEQNIEEKLTYLIDNPKLREEIGFKSRKFALKWHSTESAIKNLKSFYEILS